MTTMSEELFEALGYSLKDTAKVKIIGINSESQGVSTLIDYFEIGGTNLGTIRVVIGKVRPIFQNTIILGMNVLSWYNFAVNYSVKRVFLVERRFTKLDMSKRFTMKDITEVDLVSADERIEDI